MLVQLFVFQLHGDQLITFCTEAFIWFAPYASKGELDSFFKTSDRYENLLTVNITAPDDSGMTHTKAITLLPLPHPSPLNQKYYAAFPGMLQKRLSQVEF